LFVNAVEVFDFLKFIKLEEVEDICDSHQFAQRKVSRDDAFGIPLEVDLLADEKLKLLLGLAGITTVEKVFQRVGVFAHTQASNRLSVHFPSQFNSLLPVR